jgi:GTP diphosphokinase / guanosine-3',5'-bis(diphosphate) 3'-diphosphatase
MTGASDNPVLKIARAAHFAALKHTNHKRKGENAEPYINHLAEVAETLAVHSDGQDLNLVVAGLLHDTLEDTQTTYEELVGGFGRDVADLVKEVTDDKSLPKAERKRLQVENTPHKSARAKMLKIADKLSNLKAILNSPPHSWPPERKREYFDWARQVVDGCKGVNRGLEEAFAKSYAHGRSILNG